MMDRLTFNFTITGFEFFSDITLGRGELMPELREAVSEQSGTGARNDGGRGLDMGRVNRDLSPLILDAETETLDPFSDLALKKMFQVRNGPHPMVGSRRNHNPVSSLMPQLTA
ncbi:hypothetical protein D3C85_1439630 [compost metagenome]